MASGSDTFENIISFLIIIFFIFSGFFKKKDKKTDNKPATPLPQTQRRVERRPEPQAMPRNYRENPPQDLAEFFEDVYRRIESGTGAMPKLVPEEAPAPLKKEVLLQKKTDKVAISKSMESVRKERIPKQTLEATVASSLSSKLFFNVNEMQKAVIMSEILQKPLALRRGVSGR